MGGEHVREVGWSTRGFLFALPGCFFVWERLGRLGLRAVIQVRRRLFRPELRVISLLRRVLKDGSGRLFFRSPH